MVSQVRNMEGGMSSLLYKTRKLGYCRCAWSARRLQILSNIILWWTLAACETANLCLAVLDIFFNEASHFLSVAVARGSESLDRDVDIFPRNDEIPLLDFDLAER